MTTRKAIEIIADQNNGNPGEIKEAVEYLMKQETENAKMKQKMTLLQNRCRALTNGLLCNYCGMFDRCYKKEESKKNENRTDRR